MSTTPATKTCRRDPGVYHPSDEDLSLGTPVSRAPQTFLISLFAMRVIAGTLRRRTLEAPAGLKTRPTSDRLRETLFNVLAPRMEGARFLDLYAGSGAVGIEAASRGAANVVLVERAEPALKVLRGNLEKLGLRGGVRVEGTSVGAFLRRVRPQTTAMLFDVVFLDPPYEAVEEYATVLGLLGGDAAGMLAAGAVVVAEHRRREKLEDEYGVLRRARVLEQGDAALSFYEAVVGP